ncbi:glycosyltransferase family 87 protein [Kitasatospora sp. NPDC052896]|uniref:glycosyltransferase family 87 protein n=1 Tax=Kitasatospora sp. NPDC052896 TaxID=3364061 RepID=UPI0037C70E6A
MDDRVVVMAARTFLAGGSPYADKRFLYFPSSVLLAVPQTGLPDPLLSWLVPAVTALMVLAGWLLAVRIFGVPLRSRLAAAGVLLISFLEPFRNLVQLGNWTACSALALPAALLLARRSHWGWAGLVVGLAIAGKPMLVPLTLLFLFARQLRAFLLAVVVPVLAAVLAADLMPDSRLFFTRTLPFVLHGQDDFARPYDASLGTLLPRLGVSERMALGVAGLLAAALVLGAWRRWRLGGDEGLRLVETGAMLMVAALIVNRPSFDHYLLVVLPVLLASTVRPRAAARSPWFWLALLPRFAGFDLPEFAPAQNWAYPVATLNVTTAAVLLRRAASHPDTGTDAADPSGTRLPAAAGHGLPADGVDGAGGAALVLNRPDRA